MNTSSPLATVIIPTHDHATTVDLAIESVLEQTIKDLDVVVIGDGATEATKATVERFTGNRVRFLERPKSVSRCEEARHEVLTGASAPFVCYLGDDDLMLPDHVETMIGLLDHADFAHPLPVMVDRDGSLNAHPTDLTRPECITWHLHPTRNAISLTGAAHRLDAYRRLPFGWRAAPAGRWSDHYMWEQWFRTPGFRFVTGERLTVIKLEASVRRDMTPEERRNEILAWKARAQSSTFEDDLSREASDAFRRWAVQARLDLAMHEEEWGARMAEQAETIGGLQSERQRLEDAHSQAVQEIQRLQTIQAKSWTTIADLQSAFRDIAAQRDALQDQLARLKAEMAGTVTDLDRTRAELAATRATRTWRLHDRLARLPAIRRLAAWASDHLG